MSKTIHISNSIIAWNCSFHINGHICTYTVYLEIFVIKNSCKNFFVGRVPMKMYLHKKVLHGNNFTLSSHHYFFTRACTFDRSAIIQVRNGRRDRTSTPKSLLCSWLPRLSRDMGSSCW